MKWSDRKRTWIVDVITDTLHPDTEPWVATERELPDTVLWRTMRDMTIDGRWVCFCTVAADNEQQAKHEARRLLMRAYPGMQFPMVERW